jgi:hypothetical protein
MIALSYKHYPCPGLHRLTGITFRNKADGLGIGRNVHSKGTPKGSSDLRSHPVAMLLLLRARPTFVAEDKFSCKGVNRKTNNVTKEKYMDVLLTKQSGSGTNRGFRTIDNQVYLTTNL